MNNDLTETFADEFLGIFQSKKLKRKSSAPIQSLSLNDAYALQDRVIDSRIRQGERVAGYKVGCTSKAIRQLFNLTEPICARLMHPHIYYGDTSLNCNDFNNCAVEPEFVFMIGKDLSGEDYDNEFLKDAIEYVSPGIEVHNYKFWYGNPTSQELIASNGIHACLIVGKERTKPKRINLDAVDVGLFSDDGPMVSGKSSEIMGGPVQSLRWLVNHLCCRGETLKAGQLVIPGSPVELTPVTPGTCVTTRITHIGEVRAKFV